MPPLILPKLPGAPACSAVVLFMTGVASSAAIYTAYHYVSHSPDFAWRAEMRRDEDQVSPYLKERAALSYNTSFFRKLANWRNKEDINDGKDTRIFRGWA